MAEVVEAEEAGGGRGGCVVAEMCDEDEGENE